MSTSSPNAALFLPYFPYGRDVWKLTLHYYDHAVDLGVVPVIAHTFLDTTPGAYRTADFYFSRPPTREEVLVAFGNLPWMAVYDKTLLAQLEDTELNAWPIVQIGHKAAQGVIYRLRDGVKEQVGRIDILRERVYDNAGVRPLMLTTDLIRSVLGRTKVTLPEDAQAAGHDGVSYVRDTFGEHALERAERSLRRDLSTQDYEAALARELRLLLVAAGVLKARPKGTSRPKAKARKAR